jgi:uncharacterized oligopeptide transporter (OPT) family protein
MYPEGTACAEVLIAGEKGGTNAKTVFTGFGIGFLYKLLNGDGGLHILKNTAEKSLGFFKGALVSNEIAPEMMGVGYIIGPRIAGVVVAGSILSFLVLIPAIRLFGDNLAEPLFPATKLIKDMNPYEIRRAYVLYIGAGAVAAGGIISMIRVTPTIVSAFIAGFKDLIGDKSARDSQARTDRDLPMTVVALGSLALVAALWAIPALNVPLVGALLVILFGFMFVTVSSRLTGEIGSSSNPISGMTVATLLLTCLIFLFLGKTGPIDRVAALMIAAVVCIAASNGGTTSQDLKTGFLVGATPKAQQIGILIGAMSSALVIGYALKLFNDSNTVFAKREIPSYTVNLEASTGTQKLWGPEGARDSATYNVIHFTPENAPRGADGQYVVEPGKYLFDDQGKIRYLVDPAIYGVLKTRDPAPGQTQGAEVSRFDAPQARLMSLIIDGILTRKLPWGLVLLGVFISIFVYLLGIPVLPFAVGVYLPLATTAPIGIGGLIAWLVQRKAKKPASDAEAETSPGVLVSSGLIAGGAIAGMVCALMAGSSEKLVAAIDLSKAFGWFAQSDLVSMASFVLLGAFVFLVGRGKLLRA